MRSCCSNRQVANMSVDMPEVLALISANCGFKSLLCKRVPPQVAIALTAHAILSAQAASPWGRDVNPADGHPKTPPAASVVLGPKGAWVLAREFADMVMARVHVTFTCRVTTAIVINTAISPAFSRQDLMTPRAALNSTVATLHFDVSEVAR